ncbi:thioesterase II family protein [Aureimonas pseudogalii]|uniref:Medium-chain acyl-[acyl-carrier-protein] hydrolase n=1 Tax=Aureimonas pseudogalii TaxID=1744844 RepID=A0A7W6H484_9HYPH|nr:alpha/beta fold hydrolase [Aureimonas pseudogalii]MBB3996739.1 medium-chain acyl-[acyl-carrier-protein] hydrolase [Aureimonas pseudogalii]
MTSWFRHGPARPEATARLFCLHHAGGGASSFAGWAALAPAEIDICAVQLPGRESRMAEAPVTDMGALAARLADAMEPRLDLPYALFGHSMGARLACATAATLAARGLPAPAALIVSASRAPHHPPLAPDLHELPDERFAEALAALGGLPDAIRRSSEMMAMTMRVARADFAALETWHPPGDLRVPAAILALGGADDRGVPRSALESWADLADGGFRLRLFPGGHFYLKDQPGAVVAEACSALFRGLDAAHRRGRDGARPVRQEAHP